MNMILAAMIFTGITAIFGESRTSLVNPAYVDPSSVFASMGIKTGDRFTEINGKPAQSWEEALNPELFTARSLQYTLLRNGQAITVSAPSDILTRLNAEKTPGVRPLMPPIIDEVLRNQPAAKAGLKPGALVTMINGKEVLDWTEVVGIISSNPGKQITITWKYLNQPEGKPLTAEMIRSGGETFVSTVVPGNSGKIGISLKQTLETQRRKLNAFESVQSGVGQTWKTTVMTVQGFAKMFSGKEDFRKSVGGPIKIARIAGQSAEQGPVSFFYFVAVLSISLAFINILPVPALDGGQFLLNGIEGIIRRDIPFAVKMRIQQVGMAILMTLFVYFIINDIFNP
jgi:regulator of sigma E protease